MIHLAGHELHRIQDVAQSTADEISLAVLPRLNRLDAVGAAMLETRGYARAVADFAEYLRTGEMSTALADLLA